MATTHIDFGKESKLTGEAFVRMASATDDFERYAHPHAGRIARLADEMAKLFHLARHDRTSLRLAALAHDLGEVTMERNYIKRAGPLSDDERLDLARHPLIGEQEAARAGADRGAQLLVRWHQEWWNGGGYPDALRREQIPLAARILRVADAYASLTDDRPFRPALNEEDARKHLIDWAGLEFDPRIVRAFLNLGPLEELRSYAKRSLKPEVSSPKTEEKTERESAEESKELEAELGAEPAERLALGSSPESSLEPSPDASSVDASADASYSPEASAVPSPDSSHSSDSSSDDSRLKTSDSRF